MWRSPLMAFAGAAEELEIGDRHLIWTRCGLRGSGGTRSANRSRCIRPPAARRVCVDVSRSDDVPSSGRDVSPMDCHIDAGAHGGEQVRELEFDVNLVRKSHRKHQFLIEENLADRTMLVNPQNGFGNERRDGKYLNLTV